MLWLDSSYRACVRDNIHCLVNRDFCRNNTRFHPLFHRHDLGSCQSDYLLSCWDSVRLRENTYAKIISCLTKGEVVYASSEEEARARGGTLILK
jgi:hypothetical protein